MTQWSTKISPNPKIPGSVNNVSFADEIPQQKKHTVDGHLAVPNQDAPSYDQ